MKNIADMARSAMNKISNLFARGVLQSTDDSSPTRVQVSLSDGEVATEVEHPQEYGFNSKAPEGAEALVLFLGGNRDNPSCSVIFEKGEKGNAWWLAPGESIVYNRPAGSYIWLAADGHIEIFCAGNVEIFAPKLLVHGDIEATGNIKDAVRTMAGDRTIYNGHTHPETGGTTNPPNQPM